MSKNNAFITSAMVSCFMGLTDSNNSFDLFGHYYRMAQGKDLLHSA
jgi:hypothetical protein